MSIRRSLIPVAPYRIGARLALALLAGGCADQMGPHPAAVHQPLARAPHVLRWAGPLPPQFAISAQSGRGNDGVLLAAAPSGLSLDRYTATFWAVRGQQRSVQINYLSSTGDASFPFLRLTGVEPKAAPARGVLMPGDSVLITMIIDSSVVKLSFEPTGLEFRDPAQLQIWYGGAGGDLNGDGEVDASDAYIESQLLGMWYREGPGTAWTEISATQSLSDKSFTSALQHFSQYAVSW